MIGTNEEQKKYIRERINEILDVYLDDPNELKAEIDLKFLKNNGEFQHKKMSFYSEELLQSLQSEQGHEIQVKTYDDIKLRDYSDFYKDCVSFFIQTINIKKLNTEILKSLSCEMNTEIEIRKRSW